MKIVAYGQPGAQGSKTYMGRSKSGKGIMVESSKKVKPWRQDVKAAAEAVLESLGRPPPFRGALAVRMVFTVVRPRSHYRTGRNAHLLKDSAPTHPITPPDSSKLCRSTEDALTDAGVWRNDSQVVDYTRLAKVYAGEDHDALDRAGVLIIIGELVDLLRVEGSPSAETRTTPE